MNSIVYFEIQVKDPQKSARFYELVFGWKFIREESLPIEYYRIETSGMHGGLFQRPADIPPLNCGTNAFTCSVEVQNFDAMRTVILENGGQIAMPKFAVPGRCWQGYFLGIDHNVFGIFEADVQAK